MRKAFADDETPPWLGPWSIHRHYDPGSEAGWRSFEGELADYVVRYARLSRRWGVDLFLPGHGARPFRPEPPAFLAAPTDVRVSDAFQGPLTYAANWDEVGQVPFWAHVLHRRGRLFPALSGPEPLGVGARRSLDTPPGPVGSAVCQAPKTGPVHRDGYCCTANCAAEPWKEDPRAPRMRLPSMRPGRPSSERHRPPLVCRLVSSGSGMSQAIR